MELSVAEALELLRLQVAWGADEALDEVPHDRLAAGAAVRPAVMPSAPPDKFRPGQTLRAEAAAAAAENLEALRQTVLAFTGCALRDTASHTLLAEGGAASGLILIGEVPDADEDRAGRLFAGASGDLLDRMLASIGLTRTDMLIAPLIPWRPPGDRRVNPAELAACLPFLHRLIALARPRRLLLMGARPARALLGVETPLARMRGRWLPAVLDGTESPLPVLAMRHPGQLAANPAWRREAWHDLLLLRATLDSDASQRCDSISGSPS